MLAFHERNEKCSKIQIKKKRRFLHIKDATLILCDSDYTQLSDHFDLAYFACALTSCSLHEWAQFTNKSDNFKAHTMSKCKHCNEK